MKKFLLLLCAFGAIFTSCSEKTPTPTIEVLGGVESLTFSNEAGSQVLSFSANGAWTAEVTAGADWISLSAASGNAGEAVELTVSVTENGYDDRNGLILLSNGTATAQVAVVQGQTNALTLASSSVLVDYTGGSFSVDVDTNVELTVTCSVDWVLQVEPAVASRGIERNTFYFQVLENKDTQERSTVVTFSAAGIEPALFTVSQAGALRTPNQIPGHHIWYTTSDDAVLAPVAGAEFGATIVSNTYEAGLGVIEFDGNISKISDGAFAGLTNLTSIVLPATVAEIGANAFNGCLFLQSVYVSSLTPATLGVDAFANNGTTYTAGEGEEATEVTIVRYIYVPNAAVAAYKTAGLPEEPETPETPAEPETSKANEGVAAGWYVYADFIKGWDQETLPGFTEGNGTLE